MTARIDAQLTPEMSLNQIAAAVPRALEVFERLGLDSCCGGAKPLALVCEKHHLDLDAVLTELRAL
jgi:iron-sulfur cluster repair protein YtfE (RIC family)